MVASALLVEESRKLAFRVALTGSTPHQIRRILNQRAGRYEVILERDDLVLTTDACLNPASSLWKVEENQGASEHSCLDIIEYQTKVRPDLREVPLHDGAKLFIDVSSRVIEGKRHNGYAIIDGTKHSLYEEGRLPNNWLAQTFEFYALNQP
jgi:hypothetical protein